MPDHNIKLSAQHEFDARLTAALEKAPSITIPGNFAARIALAAQTNVAGLPAKYAPGRYARTTALVSMAVLLVLILAIARRATGPSPLWITAESIFCAQFALLAVWLVACPVQSESFWPL